MPSPTQTQAALTTFAITANGEEMGHYKGADADAALDAYALDAGYSDYATLREEHGEAEATALVRPGDLERVTQAGMLGGIQGRNDALGLDMSEPDERAMCDRMAAKLAWVMELKNVRRGRLHEYAEHFGVEFAPEPDPVAEYWDLVRGDDLWCDDRSYMDYQLGEPPEDDPSR